VVSDRGYFRYHFLDSLVYSMLGSLYLTPIHAACVTLGGSGVLLCGESGSGKTSLGYACAKRGWTYVADDASHLLRPGTDRRILGRPHEIRFRSTATLLFPELDAFAPVRRANGKLDLEIKTCDLDLSHIATETRADYLVFPKRDFGGSAGFRKLDRNSAAAWLYQVLCVGEESVRQSQRQSLAALLELPIFELCYRDPVDGEARLRALVTRCS
jgi:HPr serine kinase-like protein